MSGMNENHCGSCTLCCKLLQIPELSKPVGSWCTHCKVGHGCTKYEDRPGDCKIYTCVWRTFKAEGHPVSDALRPDRCGVIVDASSEIGPEGQTHYVRVDPNKPNAWNKPDVKALITAVFQVGPVFLVVGEKRRQLRAAK